MARLPYAAETLIEQVRTKHRRSATSAAGQNTATPADDPDGFGVHRAIQFDKTTSKWLLKVLPWIDDPRIEELEESEDGQVTVYFSAGVVADERDPFPLEEAEMVADSEDED